MKPEGLTVAAYCADVWEHVCPMLRVLRPAEESGVRVLRGVQWHDSQLTLDLEAIAAADVVLLQRNFPENQAAVEQVLAAARAHGKPVVYELDDLLTELPEEHPHAGRFWKPRAGIIRVILEADAVIGSTRAICEYMGQWNEATHLFLNYLDDRLWPRPEPGGGDPEADEIVIGFMGQESHIPDLKPIVPVLLRLDEKYNHRLRFHFWGLSELEKISRLPQARFFDRKFVSYAEFAAYFSNQHADIFIAPLAENSFNRCKSHLKFLEYSSLGVPGVYSRLTPFEGIVRDGDNGFLAESLADWEAALSRLVDSPALRRRIGREARRTVEEEWLLSANADRWRQILEGVCSRPSGEKNPLTIRTVRQLSEWYAQVEERREHERARRLQEQESRRQIEMELDRARYDLAIKSEQIDAIYESRSWRMLQLLLGFKKRYMPEGGFLSRAFRLFLRLSQRIIQSLVYDGLRYFLRNPKTVLRPEFTPKIETRLVDGNACPVPAVSIVAIRGKGVPEPDLDGARTWMQRQSIAPFLELVVWDRESGRAGVDGVAEKVWTAASPTDLCRGLSGRYVCVASPDLLEWHPTYLEENLLALESEGLQAVFNFRAGSKWVEALVADGLAPGTQSGPLLRTVARKEAVTDAWGLAYPRIEDGAGRVVSRIVYHTAAEPDLPGSIPFENNQDRLSRIFDNRGVVELDPQANFQGLTQPVIPVTQCMPPIRSEDHRPTVLIMTSFLAVGGAERLLFTLMDTLKENFRFVMLTVEPLDPSQGTTVEDFRTITPYVYTSPDFLRLPALFSLVEYLVERFNPSAVYIPNGSNWIFDTLPRFRARFPDLRIVNQVYDHAEGWINRYDQDVARIINYHIAPNRSIQRAYLEKGVHFDQIALIPHGIEGKDFIPSQYSQERKSRLREELGLPAEGKLVAFVGRLYPQKRPVDFIELARRFDTHPSVHFLMVGDGILKDTVIAQIQKTGLDNLTRLDFYRPSSDIYAIMDVLVLPSEHEAMPLAAAEAQLMGKPVVITDVGNNREVLDQTGGGVVVDTIGDIDALRKGVLQMLDQPPDPEKTRAAILSLYGIGTIAPMHSRLFQ